MASKLFISAKEVVSMIIVSSFVGWYSGLLNSVSRKESFNLSQQGLNDKYVIPEYSGWFSISCPVIWKSYFRFAFVHTQL